MAVYFEDWRIAKLPGMSRYDDPSKAAQYEYFKKTPFYDILLFVLPALPGMALEAGKLFSKFWGRPTADLVTLTGRCLMAEAFDWTAEEPIRRLASDMFVQMALNLPENPTDRERVVSERTRYDFRKKFQEAGGPRLAALSLTSRLNNLYCVEAKAVRLDSSDVRSDAKGLAAGGALFQ
ncbi:MAG: hypothetical protein LBQ12_09830 [Deltaproteobacteria bacterium]|jgi:hypothetical protein|nr:hypothetical protein [Deltaproteobacteria bacterium]